MKYMMTGIDGQEDKGFGITADAFLKAGDVLFESEIYNKGFNPQKHMPIFYMYRHSIELYFKSMITIFHTELELGGKKSKIEIKTIDGKSKELGTCHWVDALFWYWSKIINDNKEKLINIAPNGSWETIHPDLEGLIETVSIYDKDSTFFRYPFSKGDRKIKDNEKYSMKKIKDIKDLQKSMIAGSGFTFLLKDQDENITSIYSHDDNLLSDVLIDFKITSEILHNYHLMTRMTLCEGF